MHTTLHIDDIKVNPENPRRISQKQLEKLKASILSAPWMLELRPLILNDDNTVLGGNMRLFACKELNIQEIPVLYAKNLTPEQQKEFIIKDNLSYGDWDEYALRENWSVETLNDWGLKIKELDALEVKEINYAAQYEVVIECAGETEQRLIYEQLTKEGKKCRVLTI